MNNYRQINTRKHGSAIRKANLGCLTKAIFIS